MTQTQVSLGPGNRGMLQNKGEERGEGVLAELGCFGGVSEKQR